MKTYLLAFFVTRVTKSWQVVPASTFIMHSTLPSSRSCIRSHLLIITIVATGSSPKLHTMASRYRQILGLGVLGSLPPEVRERIYDAYFGIRVVTPAHKKRYDCSLLAVSRTIYEEAKAVEMKPGFTLVISAASDVSPEHLRKLVTELSLSDLFAVQPLVLTDYTALQNISASVAGYMPEAEEYGGSACIDRLLKGTLDASFINHLRDLWGSQVGKPFLSFDWHEVPASIKVWVDFTLYFQEDDDEDDDDKACVSLYLGHYSYDVSTNFHP